jgi:hypothetical protein
MPRYTFSVLHDDGGEAPEAVAFDLHIFRPSVPVTVSREALEDLAAARRIDVTKLAGGLREFAETILPNLAETAFRKLRTLESIEIVAGDELTTWSDRPAL